MKNRPITFAGRTASSLAGLFNSLLGREQAAAEEAVLVKVWDTRSDAYRTVNLSDHNDPLWATAMEVARFSGAGPRGRSAA